MDLLFGELAIRTWLAWLASDRDYLRYALRAELFAGFLIEQELVPR